MTVRYPQVEVQLVGLDGNAFAIISWASQAAHAAGLSTGDIEAYRKEAMSGDYTNLSTVTMDWFDCDEGYDDLFNDEPCYEDESRCWEDDGFCKDYELFYRNE